MLPPAWSEEDLKITKKKLLILALLLIQRRDQVWIAYVVMAFIVGAQAFFEPARTATIPNVTSAPRTWATTR